MGECDCITVFTPTHPTPPPTPRPSHTNTHLHTHTHTHTQVKYFARRKAYNRTVKQKKKAYKQKFISNLNDALGKDPQTVWKMLRELKDSENAEGENKCQASATKWINHLENLIIADVNVSHERKRQVETELANAVKDTKSAHLDRPITSAEVVQACRTLKNRKAPGKELHSKWNHKGKLTRYEQCAKQTFQRNPKHRSQPRFLEDRGKCPYL